jgi:hypothetical protein
MDESRKRVIGIMAAILASLHMQTADDLFGTPSGSPRTDRLIEASIQWASSPRRPTPSQKRWDVMPRWEMSKSHEYGDFGGGLGLFMLDIFEIVQDVTHPL